MEGTGSAPCNTTDIASTAKSAIKGARIAGVKTIRDADTPPENKAPAAFEATILRITSDLALIGKNSRKGSTSNETDGADFDQGENSENEDSGAAEGVEDAVGTELQKIVPTGKESPPSLLSIIDDLHSCLGIHYPPRPSSSSSSPPQSTPVLKKFQVSPGAYAIYTSLTQVALLAADGHAGAFPPPSKRVQPCPSDPSSCLRHAARLLHRAVRADLSSFLSFLKGKQAEALRKQAQRLADLHAWYLKGPTLPPALPPTLTPSHSTLLEATCVECFDRLCPPPDLAEEVEAVRDRLEGVLREHPAFRSARVLVFGSAPCGLGSSGR